MESKYERALALARKAHAGQVDKAGNDYINHPLYVASHCASEDEKVVALLHDTVEDTDVTLSQIEEMFGSEIATAVGLLTHAKSDDYDTYLRKLKKNPLAKAVKLQDVLHNADIGRIENPTEKDYERLQKYKHALDILLFTRD